MIKLFGQSINRGVLLLALVEAACVYTAIFVIATLVVHSPDGPSGLTSAAWLPAMLIVLGMLALGIYEPDARAHLPTMTERLAVACVAGAGLGFAIIYPFGTIWMSPLYAIAIASFSYATVTAARFVLGRMLRLTPFQRRIVALGGANAVNALRVIAARRGSTADVVASMTLDEAMEPEALRRIASGCEATEIVVAERSGTLPAAALLDCKAAGIHITDAMDFGEEETGKVDLDNLYPARFIFSRNGGRTRWSMRGKRAIDIAVSGIALSLLAPLFAVVALAIRADSPGGVFYRQTRTGLNGAPYEIVKFRSMRNDAEASGKPQWAQANDSRVTKVGHFLRQTRIDELPQLWNILRGEMSLVGPRPERPFFVEQLAEKLPFYNERHRVKPGLTGWAQVKYRYGASEEDAEEKLRYDLYYVKNHNTMLDISIMMRTLRVVLWPDGVH